MTSNFIITSAIHTYYGKCSTEERIEQTKETIKKLVQNIHRMGIEGYWAPLKRWIEGWLWNY